MKKTTYLAMLAFSIFVFSFVSCNDDDDNGGGNTTFVYIENGSQIENWETTVNYSTEYDNGYHTEWISVHQDSDRAVTLELGSPADPYDLSTGTFDHLSTDADIKFEIQGIEFNSPDDASITISEVDEGSKTVSGSFTFQIDEVFSNGDVHQYDVSGQFTDFPY